MLVVVATRYSCSLKPRARHARTRGKFRSNPRSPADGANLRFGASMVSEGANQAVASAISTKSLRMAEPNAAFDLERELLFWLGVGDSDLPSPANLELIRFGGVAD